MKSGFTILLLLISLCSCTNVNQPEIYDNTADIEFLKENANKNGVETTSSGLQYRVIKEGDGDRPTLESKVRVHYTGTFIDGGIFDSSRNGAPAEFFVKGVIPGWTEGLQLMKEGARYEFFLPAELGYGNMPPRGSPIEPGMTLIFDVELLEIIE